MNKLFRFILKTYLVVAIIMTVISLFSFTYSGRFGFDMFIYVMNVFDLVVYLVLWSLLKRKQK